MNVLNAVVQGLLTGGLYACAGVGLTLVFGILKLVNLAHGQIVIAGAFISYWLTTSIGIDPMLSIPIVGAIAALIGYLLHRGLLAGLAEHGETGPLVATFGVALLIQAILAQIFTNNAKSVPASYAAGGIDLGPVRVQTVYVIAFALSVLVTGAVYWLLHRTRWGAAARAAGTQPSVVSLVGIDVRRVHATVFALACGLAAVSGILVGLATSVTPSSGPLYLVYGFAVVVLGGVGNVVGTLLASLLLGVVQSLTSISIGGGYREFVAFALFLVVLAFRPQGLFSKVAKA